MSIKFLVWGGGGILVWGGGSADFIFMGAGIFLKKARETPKQARAFLFAERLKSLEKEGKTHKNKKLGKSENEKSKEIVARVRGPR